MKITRDHRRQQLKSRLSSGPHDDVSLLTYMHMFIHSFIPAISIAPLQVLYYSEALPTTARILILNIYIAPLQGNYSEDTVSEFHAEAHSQLQVKDLPKVPTWRLERESNPLPSG